MKNTNQINKISKLNEQIAKVKMGSLFLQVRTQRNLKQVDFAKVIGVTQGAVSKIEAGQLSPDVFTYLKFSRQFGVEVL